MILFQGDTGSPFLSHVMSGGGVACVSNIDLWKMMIDYIEDYMQNVYV